MPFLEVIYASAEISFRHSGCCQFSRMVIDQFLMPIACARATWINAGNMRERSKWRGELTGLQAREESNQVCYISYRLPSSTYLAVYLTCMQGSAMFAVRGQVDTNKEVK